MNLEATAVTATPKQIETWTRLVRAEYLAMPGLHLTKPQIQRLWRLDPAVCDAVLDALVDAGVLRCTPRGGYVLDSR